MKSIIKVKGMTCHSCETILREAALEVAGVSAAKADSKKGVLEVEASDSALRGVLKAVRDSGYSVEGVE